MSNAGPKGRLILVEQAALDTVHAVVAEARAYMTVPVRLDAARRSCVIQVVDGRNKPEDVIKARRN